MTGEQAGLGLSAVPAGRPAWKWLLAVGALALGLVVVDSTVARLRSGGESAWSDAQWIWARESARQAGPVAFMAVRDFELETVPAGAELLIHVDEEYLVHVNGRFVGSGRYGVGVGMHRYAVGELLEAGLNRIVVEARALRGAGGILVALLDPSASAALLVSDADWSIVRAERRGLRQGLVQVQPAEPPEVWGRAPTGRWDRTLPADELRRPGWHLPWMRARLTTADGCRGRFLALAAAAQASAADDAGGPACPWCCPLTSIELDSELEGTLELELERPWRGGSGRRPVLWLDGDPAARVELSSVDGSLVLEASGAAATVIPVPGGRRWRLAGVHRFSRAWVAGVAVTGARALPATGPATEPAQPSRTDDGVWGLELPRRYPGS